MRPTKNQSKSRAKTLNMEKFLWLFRDYKMAKRQQMKMSGSSRSDEKKDAESSLSNSPFFLLSFQITCHAHLDEGLPTVTCVSLCTFANDGYTAIVRLVPLKCFSSLHWPAIVLVLISQTFFLLRNQRKVNCCAPLKKN